MVQQRRGVGPYLIHLGLSAVLNIPRLLPYRWRVPFGGWLAARVVSPIAGYHKRVRRNLALACPDLTEPQIARLERQVLTNSGRFLTEMWSGTDLFNRMKGTRMTGPGLDALNAAKAQGRPIIGVSAHFGSYDAARAVLIQAGFDMGGLYRPMSNAYFNKSYVARMSSFQGKAFEQTRRGMAQMVKHLRGGGFLAVIIDQREDSGTPLRFFGQPAMTTLALAEMALKYDTLFIPIFGIRKENGLDFDVVVQDPIPHSDPETMMQDYNDRLETLVRAHMDQYFWVHNRWQMPADTVARKNPT